MKKIIVSLVVLGVIVASFSSVAAVSAQGPYNPNGTGVEYGQGGGRYGYLASDELHVENEAVHDLMMDAWSVELGLSVEELNTREEAGETISQIAFSEGFTFEEFWTIKTRVQTDVANQALAEGLITQAEADWMLQRAVRQTARLGGRAATGTGGFMGRGMRGTGLNSAGCTNLP